NKVTDADTGPEKMAADYSWSFTTLAADAAPAVSTTSPASGAAGVTTSANVTIRFSEPVMTSDGWFSIACLVSGTHTAAASGGPTAFSLDPVVDFTNNESCTV